MLKLKRTYDDMAFGSSPSPACSPHKITFLDNNQDASPFKRARTSNYNPNQGFLSTSPHESNFPTTSWNIDSMYIFFKYLFSGALLFQQNPGLKQVLVFSLNYCQ